MRKLTIRLGLNHSVARPRPSERRQAALCLGVAHRLACLEPPQHQPLELPLPHSGLHQQHLHLEHSVNKSLPRRSVGLVQLNRRRIRLGLRHLDSHNQLLEANRLGPQHQPSVRSLPLRSVARQRRYSDPLLLPLERHRLQLLERQAPQLSERPPLLHSEQRLLLPLERLLQRLHSGRQLRHLGGARCLGKVRLRLVQLQHQHSGARRRHHRLGLLQGVHLVAPLVRRPLEVSSSSGLEPEWHLMLRQMTRTWGLGLKQESSCVYLLCPLTKTSN